jgi:hypothetical protein
LVPAPGRPPAGRRRDVSHDYADLDDRNVTFEPVYRGLCFYHLQPAARAGGWDLSDEWVVVGNVDNL